MWKVLILYCNGDIFCSLSETQPHKSCEIVKHYSCPFPSRFSLFPISSSPSFLPYFGYQYYHRSSSIDFKRAKSFVFVLCYTDFSSSSLSSEPILWIRFNSSALPNIIQIHFREHLSAPKKITQFVQYVLYYFKINIIICIQTSVLYLLLPEILRIG